VICDNTKRFVRSEPTAPRYFLCYHRCPGRACPAVSSARRGYDVGNDDCSTEVGVQPRVLIVCDGASTRFGGESILPWHYFRILRNRGIDARLIVQARTRDELLALRPDDADRMYFIPDTTVNILAARASRFLPTQLWSITFGSADRLSTQLFARKLARQLVAEYGIDVIHQPAPVSPREPSLLHGFGVPVMIGPMNGNMSYPPAFRKRGKRKVLTSLVSLARVASRLLHRLMPGKLCAAALLVANERTRLGLPAGVQGEVITLVENGVDLEVWSPSDRASRADGPARFVFVGRLIELKAVDILLDAFAQVRAELPPHLEILGDGPMRAGLEAQANSLGVSDRVHFGGWLPQDECARRLREADVLVFPSLHECGGAVVLEAMACGLPVIAMDWGGPADYVDASCGILIPPDSREACVSGFAGAMSRLAADPGLRATLGLAGRERIENEFDWERKCDRILAIYRNVRDRRPSNGRSTLRPDPQIDCNQGLDSGASRRVADVKSGA
jgi:glycosyltransferase involved in cell wall biosynthesis